MTAPANKSMDHVESVFDAVAASTDSAAAFLCGGTLYAALDDPAINTFPMEMEEKSLKAAKKDLLVSLSWVALLSDWPGSALQCWKRNRATELLGRRFPDSSGALSAPAPSKAPLEAACTHCRFSGSASSDPNPTVCIPTQVSLAADPAYSCDQSSLGGYLSGVHDGYNSLLDNVEAIIDTAAAFQASADGVAAAAQVHHRTATETVAN
jgi:hypothetical protein